MRKNYDQELTALRSEIIRMGNLIETAIEDSARAFKNNDLELCEKIIRGDRDVNALEKNIESKCLWLIAREQPIASDLRLITTALKMITDLERIGDQAADIAELTMRIAAKNSFSDSGHIPQMANVAIAMVHDAVSSYVNMDLELAHRTIQRDDEVDALFDLVKTELVTVFQSGETDIDNAVDFLMIAKYLERIGDHAVNICEWVDFSQTGTHKTTKIF
jgi:phosphate transport system protein